MADLTDNELRAVAYFSIGVSSEGKDASYRLAFAGNTVRDAAGNVNLLQSITAGYRGYRRSGSFGPKEVQRGQ